MQFMAAQHDVTKNQDTSEPNASAQVKSAHSKAKERKKGNIETDSVGHSENGPLAGAIILLWFCGYSVLQYM